ncbi:MAG: hypothetical protein AB7K24_28465 [Gemmataceae bacterium]
MSRKKRLFLISLVLAAPLITTVAVASFRPYVFLPAHQHCIKMAGMALHEYAETNQGRFPSHAEGYGNALLLIQENWWHAMTGPGYDVAAFREAQVSGRGLSEEQCGRVYVQGLNANTSGEVVVLFDKLSTPGGDHSRLPARLFMARRREVLHVDGHMDVVSDENWSAFAAGQIELLVKAGIPRAEAERLYAQVHE